MFIYVGLLTFSFCCFSPSHNCQRFSTASQMEKGPDIPSDAFDGLVQTTRRLMLKSKNPGWILPLLNKESRLVLGFCLNGLTYSYQIFSQINSVFFNGFVSESIFPFVLQLKLTPSQMKSALKTYMDSVLTTCGKLRYLLREVDQNYNNRSTMQSYVSLFFY